MAKAKGFGGEWSEGKPNHGGNGTRAAGPRSFSKVSTNPVNWQKRIQKNYEQIGRKAKPSTGIPSSIWEWFAQTAKPIEFRPRGSQENDSMLLGSVREVWRDIFGRKKKSKEQAKPPA